MRSGPGKTMNASTTSKSSEAAPPAREEPRSIAQLAADATNYEHRNFVNLAAAAFLLVIAVCIVWTVQAIEKQEKLQTCLNSGRRDCVQLDAPVRPSIRMPSHAH